MERGYIKVWRKIKDTSFFKNSHCVHLAIYLLLQCNHAPKKFTFNNREQLCERGQYITGLKKMAEDTGISIRSLRTSLHTLANTGFLTSKATNRFTLISIGKYSDYQDKATSKATNKRQTNDKQTTTNNNYKNYKKGARPTLQEVIDCCKAEGYNKVNPKTFWQTQEAKGWLIGSTPIMNWKALIAKWEDSEFTRAGGAHDRQLAEAEANKKRREAELQAQAAPEDK